MGSIARLEVLITANSRQMEGELQRATRATRSFGDSIKNALSVAAGIGIAKVVSEVGQAIGGLARAGLDFEAGMANVNSIAQLSEEELGRLSDRIINLANDPRIKDGPAQLAEGLYQIYSSGFQGSDGLKILESSSIAASAGLTTTEVAAAAATSVLNAYGMKADEVNHVNDVMFQTVNDGVITYDQLARNLGNVIPVAASLGISIEEVGAAFAQMTLSGVNASAAETQIAALMRSALNPTEALTAAVQAHGYASAAAAIEAEGLAGFLKIVTDAAGGDKEALFALLGTQEAMNAATILGKNGVKDYVKELNRMKRASEGSGATQRALTKQMQSTRYQLALAKKEFQVVGAVLMGLLAPGIGFAAEKLAGFARGIAVFLHYIDMVLDGHSRWTKSLELLPDGFQRAARGIGLVIDALADLYRAFQSGGIQGFMDELGRIQGDRLISGLRTIGEEAWKALSDAFQGAASAGLQIASVAVDVLAWAVGKIPDLWDWFKSAIGVGPIGDGTDPGASVTLTDVLVNVLSWAEGQIADLGNFIQTQIDNLTDVSAELREWKLIIFGPDKVEAGPSAQGDSKGKIQQIVDGWNAINAKMKWIAEMDPSPKIEMNPQANLATLNNFLQRWASGEEFKVTIFKWTIDIPGDPTIGMMGPGELGQAAGNAIRDLLGTDITVELPHWNLSLPSPDIGGLGGLFGIDDLGISLAISKLINDITVPLSNWHLDIPSPDLTGYGAADLEGDVNAFLDGIGDIAPSLAGWILTLPTPEIAGLSKEIVISKILEALVAMGDISIPFPGNISIDFPFLGNKLDNPIDTPSVFPGGGADPLSFTATITADTSAFHAAINEALGTGQVWDGMVFTADAAGDATLFHAAINEALGTGQAWDGMTFTSDIAGDTSMFQAAINEALGTGQVWDSMTFTADINANDNASGVIQSVINGLNSIPTSVTTTINTVNTSTTIPARARGGLVTEALTWVGEQGPELVSLPYGSYVHTAGQSRTMANGMRSAGSAFALANRGGSGSSGEGGDTVEIHVHAGGSLNVPGGYNDFNAAMTAWRQGQR